MKLPIIIYSSRVKNIKSKYHHEIFVKAVMQMHSGSEAVAMVISMSAPAVTVPLMKSG